MRVLVLSFWLYAVASVMGVANVAAQSIPAEAIPVVVEQIINRIDNLMLTLFVQSLALFGALLGYASTNSRRAGATEKLLEIAHDEIEKLRPVVHQTANDVTYLRTALGVNGLNGGRQHT